jgi:hypothetical protein
VECFRSTFVDDIPQRATLNALGTCPSVAEIQEHITKLAKNKSPGESGVPAEALKALPPDGIEYVHTLLQDYWDGHSDYEEWQTALLRVLYKKGDRKEPTNYQGIVLQDACARLLSAIIGGHLHKLLKKCGMEEQFAYQEQTGTANAAYCLCSALQLRREHNQNTYVLFVDLIKAFDTANHDLLFEILAKYGTPPPSSMLFAGFMTISISSSFLIRRTRHSLTTQSVYAKETTWLVYSFYS